MKRTLEESTEEGKAKRFKPEVLGECFNTEVLDEDMKSMTLTSQLLCVCI